VEIVSKREKEKQRLIGDLVNALSENNLAIFAGAGLSIPAGYVNWKELLSPIAEGLDLDVNKETDLIALAQYHCNSNLTNRGSINQILVNEFSQNAKLTDNHWILARLPIETFWTTNYDKLLETALAEAGKTPDVKYTTNQLAYTKPKRNAVVYKMHGDVEHPSDVVLTKDDYENYHIKMQPFLTALSGDLVSKTFLFLGFSFTDPNIDFILSRVRVAYNKDQRQHYCILKKVEKETDEDQADFEYRDRKQELFVQDLLRFGIKSLLVSSYSEINEILVRLEQCYKQKTIFISGAAHDYGQWGKEASENFVYKLSKEISQSGCRVVSGFGLGIGSSVITGVLESVYMNGGRLDNDQLLLRPFPQSQVGSADLTELWTEYRNDMLSYSGIAIFLFGNKVVNGSIELSNGMREEYEIAKKQGIFLIPVGATGFVSKELWEDVIQNDMLDNIPNADEIRNKFVALGDESKSLDQIKSLIIEIINLLNR